jgi:hypothetical protein
MRSSTQTLMPEVNKLSEIEGLGWITALKGGQIRSLVEGEALQLGLFDERNRASLRRSVKPLQAYHSTVSRNGASARSYMLV